MKEFLKKFLSEEELKTIEEKYVAKNPDAKGLPVYISKERLDEVLGQKKEADGKVTSLTQQIDTLNKGGEAKTKEAVQKAQDDAKAAHDKEIAALQNDFNITEAIYKAHGRNVKAVRALVDPVKKIDEEIARIQKEEPYLFGTGVDVPPGTGKTDVSSGGSESAETNRMRAAVGLPPLPSTESK